MVKPSGASWEGAVSHPGHRRYRRSFPTEKQARDWEIDSKARLIRGEPVELAEATRKGKSDTPYTLKELVQYVYETHWVTQASAEKSPLNANSIISHICPDMPIKRLTKAMVDRARAALLAEGNAPATVNRKIAALSKALSEAEELEIIPRKPKCSRYKESEHRVRRFTPSEERMTMSFFERISNQDMADYAVLSLDTGMRQGEVLQLRHEDAQDGRVTVWGVAAGQRSKSGKSRTVPLTERAKGVFKRRAEGALSAHVFPNLNRNQVAHYWGRLSEALELDHDKQFVPHILRHEFCSRLAANGENAAVIQKLAGHSSLAVTQRYIHLFGPELDGAIERMEGRVDQAISTDDIVRLKTLLAKLSPEDREALLNAHTF